MRFFSFISAFVMGITLNLSLVPHAAFGEMMAMSQVSLEKYVAHLDSLAKTRKLNEQELQFKVLADVAQKVLNANSLEVIAGPESFSRVTLSSFSDCFLNSIYKQNKWSLQLSKAAEEKIIKNRATLEKSFGLNTYLWAWFQWQLGEKDAAKKTLKSLYDKEFLRVMALKEAVFGLRGITPMGEAEFIHQALSPLSTVPEQEEINRKMQKMKAHLSNLPQSHIVT